MTLTEEQKTLFFDLWMNGASYSKIADALNISDKTVFNLRKKLGLLPRTGRQNWTPEEDQTIHDKWRTHSWGWIAKELGRTRNAVVGRADRLGIKKENGGGATEVKLFNPRNGVRKGPPRIKSPKKPKIIEIQPSLRLSLIELEDHQCAWIYDDGYCGHQKVSKSYCAGHERMAHETDYQRRKRKEASAS